MVMNPVSVDWIQSSWHLGDRSRPMGGLFFEQVAALDAVTSVTAFFSQGLSHSLSVNLQLSICAKSIRPFACGARDGSTSSVTENQILTDASGSRGNEAGGAPSSRSSMAPPSHSFPAGPRTHSLSQRFLPLAVPLRTSNSGPQVAKLPPAARLYRPPCCRSRTPSTETG
jgi:hypothetical protein